MPDARSHLPAPLRAPIRSLDAVIRVRGEDTAGALAVIEHVIPPGTVSMPVHRHTRETETLLVQEGTLTLKVDGRVLRVEPGSWVALPPGVAHTLWNSSKRPTRFLAMYAPAGIEKFYEEVSAVIPAQGTVEIERVLEVSIRYGLEFDMPSLLDIIERYDVKLV
ncbi:MAG TPA: cupin domain-containing protein [Longimicrobiaceae bacterium]|nr:cupin domain-containing protein [Longimicrobiaceae bacterium]